MELNTDRYTVKYRYKYIVDVDINFIHTQKKTLGNSQSYPINRVKYIQNTLEKQLNHYEHVYLINVIIKAFIH